MLLEDFIKNYVSDNKVVLCETEECAIKFTKLADDLGFRLYRGGKYSEYNMWDKDRGSVGYDLNSRGIVNINELEDTTRIVKF